MDGGGPWRDLIRERVENLIGKIIIIREEKKFKLCILSRDGNFFLILGYLRVSDFNKIHLKILLGFETDLRFIF